MMMILELQPVLRNRASEPDPISRHSDTSICTYILRIRIRLFIGIIITFMTNNCAHIVYN